MNPDELRERAEQARRDIESGNYEAAAKALEELKALEAEAKQTKQQASADLDQTYQDIGAGTHPAGRFAQNVAAVVAFFATIGILIVAVWSFFNNYSWPWDLVFIAGAVLLFVLLPEIVAGVLKAFAGIFVALRAYRRTRPKSIEKQKQRELARQEAERRQKERERIRAVRQQRRKAFFEGLHPQRVAMYATVGIFIGLYRLALRSMMGVVRLARSWSDDEYPPLPRTAREFLAMSEEEQEALTTPLPKTKEPMTTEEFMAVITHAAEQERKKKAERRKTRLPPTDKTADQIIQEVRELREKHPPKNSGPR